MPMFVESVLIVDKITNLMAPDLRGSRHRTNRVYFNISAIQTHLQ